MDTQRLNRIRFRAWRRGFREADLILGGFADACLR
jgi:antitoxin CptB